jgi:gentisate 1,2-dioxygenase
MSKHLKCLWVAINGSIFTEPTFRVKAQLSPNGKILEQQLSIAFNVGEEAARHIVDLHNSKVIEDRQLAALDLIASKCV